MRHVGCFLRVPWFRLPIKLTTSTRLVGIENVFPIFSVNQIKCRWLKRWLFYGKSRHISYNAHITSMRPKNTVTNGGSTEILIQPYFFSSKTVVYLFTRTWILFIYSPYYGISRACNISLFRCFSVKLWKDTIETTSRV
jgi:hypothetical protein